MQPSSSPMFMIKPSSLFVHILSVLLCGAFSTLAHAGNGDKALQHLNAGEYPKARTYLEKGLKKDSTNYAMHYLWATYFAASDNEARNVDSAYFHLKPALAGPDSTVKEKVVRKNTYLGARPYNMQKLLAQLTEEAYDIADSLGTVAGWEHYIGLYPHSPRLAAAQANRNELAFEQAKAANTYESYKYFIEQYPLAAQIPQAENEAKARYERLFYEEKTAPGTLQDYTEFIVLYPNNPYAAEAEDKVYEIETKNQTILEYTNFVSRYPRNRNINKAWEELYDAYNLTRSTKELERFKGLFPAYPFQQQLADDIRFSKMAIRLDEVGGLYGYVDSLTGLVIINAKYPDAYPFSENLAAVSLVDCENHCLYGYINPMGKLVIEPKYHDAEPFTDGLALVSVGDCEAVKCKWGFINRKGKAVVPIEFDDAVAFSEGLSLVRKGSKYGFVSRTGKVAIPLQFADAYSFSEGFAAFRIDSLWGYVDTAGQTVIAPQYRQARSFHEGLAAAVGANGKWGYLNKQGSWAIEPQYDAADPFADGKAKVLQKQKKGNTWQAVDLVIDATGKEVR